MDKSLKYLYCVIDAASGKQFSTPGIGDSAGTVHTIIYKNIAMVVSDVSEEFYDPIRKNILCHEKVNSEALQEYSVVPVRFGIVIPSREEVIRILKLNYKELAFALQHMKNKMELGLTISWEKDSFTDEICSANHNIERLMEKIAQAEPDQIYPLQIQLGQMIEPVVEQKRAAWREKIYQELAPGAVDTKFNNTISERMIINVSFLVEKNKEVEFDQLVDKFYLKYQDGLQYKYSGPWPPWNFVKVNLKLE